MQSLRLSSQPEHPAPIRRQPANRHSVFDETTKLQPLQIGSLMLDMPIVQAALSGYSDWPMRVVARRLGAPYTIAEVMIDRFVNDLKANRERTKHFLKVTAEEHPVGGQLMGSDPADFEIAAGRLVEAGFDVIDINFGCPVKSAMGGCRGGYHLGQPVEALKIVSTVRNVVPPHVPVTVKMRRGIDDSDESTRRFFEILDGAFSLGISGITVHGRTVEQKYNGPSSWDFLRQVKHHVGDKTIIGSGDLFTAQDCLDMLQYTQVDGASVARGAIGNPWIFSQARKLLAGEIPAPPSLSEQRRVLLMQFELCQKVYTEKQVVSTMRKFGIKFSCWHPNHEAVRNEFAKARSETSWHIVLDQWYASDR